MKTKAFTLLELILVIIIISVLAALGLTKMFTVIENARSTEALATLSTIRSAVERCVLMSDNNPNGCTTFVPLDIEDPSNAPNSHFSYSVWVLGGFGQFYMQLKSVRNNNDGSKYTGDEVSVFLGTRNVVTCGTGIYNTLGNCPRVGGFE